MGKHARNALLAIVIGFAAQVGAGQLAASISPEWHHVWQSIVFLWCMLLFAAGLSAMVGAVGFIIVEGLHK